MHSVGAFQFLLKLATLVPAALERVPSKCPTKFNVVHGPLLWYIRDQWIGPIIKKMQKTVVHPDKWPKFGWPEGRTPYEYQTQAVNDMLARITTNRHFLWCFLFICWIVLLIDLPCLWEKSKKGGRGRGKDEHCAHVFG